MQEFRLFEQDSDAPGQISPLRAGDPATSHQQVTPSKMGGDMSKDCILHGHPLSIFLPSINLQTMTRCALVTSSVPLCSNTFACPFLPREATSPSRAGISATGQGQGWVH